MQNLAAQGHPPKAPQPSLQIPVQKAIIVTEQEPIASEKVPENYKNEEKKSIDIVTKQGSGAENEVEAEGKVAIKKVEEEKECGVKGERVQVSDQRASGEKKDCGKVGIKNEKNGKAGMVEKDEPVD